MICFRDMTFCSAPCANMKCERQFTDEQSKRATDWWGSPEAPVAFSDLSPGCLEFEPKEKQDGDVI